METSPEDATGTGLGAEPPPEPRGLRFNLRELILIAALIALVLAAMTPWYQRRRDLALISQVRSDLRSVATAIEAYMIDFMTYPLCGLAEGPPRTAPDGRVTPSGALTVHSHLPEGSGARRTITFGLVSPAPHTLTTPIAYLSAYPPDPFADTRGATFGYYTHGQPHRTWRPSQPRYGISHSWILWSVGPDRDENAEDGSGDLGPCVETVFYRDITDSSPVRAQADMCDLIYNPTNGVHSDGDIAQEGGIWQGMVPR
jgi:type II secretory pathway pseudopilin PulG